MHEETDWELYFGFVRPIDLSSLFAKMALSMERLVLCGVLFDLLPGVLRHVGESYSTVRDSQAPFRELPS